MLTGLQDMKDHKTELKNLSEPAGRVILQNKASVCNQDMRCVSALKLSCCYYRLDFVF